MKPMRAPPDYHSGVLIGQLLMFYDPVLDKLDAFENFDENEVDPNTLCGTMSIYQKGCGIYSVYYFFDKDPILVRWYIPEPEDSVEDEPESYCEAVFLDGGWLLTESDETVHVTSDEDSYEKTGILTVVNILLFKKEEMPLLIARIENPSAI